MATSTTSVHAGNITQAMRDRQARGKDPYSLEEEGPFTGSKEDGDFIWEQGQRVRKHHETWEQKERTSFATRILSNPDLLLWHAQAKGDTVTAQRLRFTAMLCGYEDPYETRPPQKVAQQQQQQQKQQGGGASPSSGQGPRRGGL